MKTIASIVYLTMFVFSSMLCIAQEKTQLSDAEILKLYEDLRVADVSDGMDIVGLRDIGLMGQEITALWKDIENFNHQFRGIAVTARYVPTNKVVENPIPSDHFKKWEGEWYSSISPEPFVEFLKQGSVVIIDCSGDGDTGSVGSFNSLAWVEKGAVGIVSNGGIRDTDEIIKQEIPVYLDKDNRGRGIRPGRNELESVQKPVVIGGVLIYPGDVVVADGDGVIVVPREYAEDVAVAAKGILENDKAARKSLYEKLGIPLDHTVE
jgi:4-hydroxy-4-methyl-2-oxoglutarate aldolase